MANVLHIEIAQKYTSKLKQSEILKLVKNAVEKVENPVRKFCLHENTNLELRENVESVRFCSGVTTLKTCQSDAKNVFWEKKAHEFLSSFSAEIHTKSEFHVFKLSKDEEKEKKKSDKENSKVSEKNSQFRRVSLPSGKLGEEWENLVFDPALKTRLLDYIKTAMIYSQKRVSGSLINFSKTILILGPSGTGKTSLCRAFANKSVIRLGNQFKNGQLIEIDIQNLFSQRFSESVKFIERSFLKIRNFLEDSKTLVFLLIDQVENLATTQTTRNFRRNESADSLRTVHNFLTKLDKIKTEFPNFVLLTTSSLVGLIDISFLDQADLRLFLGNPTAELIYEIHASSINELIRVEIIGEDEGAFLPPKKQLFDTTHQNYGLALKLWEISVLSINFTGRILKRIPFLAHCNFINSTDGSCSVAEYLEAMRSAVLAEKQQSENIDIKFLASETGPLTWNNSYEPQIISVRESTPNHQNPQQQSSSFFSSFSASASNDHSQNCEEILIIVPEEIPSTSNSTSAPQRQPSISAESTTTSASISDSISTPSPNSSSGSTSTSSSFNLKIINSDVRVNITPLPSPYKKISSSSQKSSNRQSSISEAKKEEKRKRKTMKKHTEKITESKSSKIKKRDEKKSTTENSESPNQNQPKNQSEIPRPNSTNHKKGENRRKLTKKYSKDEKSDTDDEETGDDGDSDLSERRRSSRISRKMSKGKEIPKVEMNKEFFILKHLNPDVEAKLSELPCAGQGLFAKKDFQPGEFLTEYGGALLSRKEGILKEREYQTADKSLFLFFFTHEDSQYCIDAMESTSYGRFINHSKARANAVVKRVTVEGLPKLYFVASKSIRKGTEILYDYGETRPQVLKLLPWLKF